MRGQLITVLVSLLPELNPVPSDASSRFVQSEVDGTVSVISDWLCVHVHAVIENLRLKYYVLLTSELLLSVFLGTIIDTFRSTI